MSEYNIFIFLLKKHFFFQLKLNFLTIDFNLIIILFFSISQQRQINIIKRKYTKLFILFFFIRI